MTAIPVKCPRIAGEYMEEKDQVGQREQHLLKLLQEANRRIEELEAEKRAAK